MASIEEDTGSSVSEAVYLNRASGDESQKYMELGPQTIDIGSENASKFLRELKESVLGRDSDRSDWREVDCQTIEKLKADYDKFFYSVPAAETTINFNGLNAVKVNSAVFSLYLCAVGDNRQKGSRKDIT